MGVQYGIAQAHGQAPYAKSHIGVIKKNVEDLPRQPKYTNPYPWGDPYKGIHKGGRPKAAPLCGGGRRPPPLYGSLHGHGFVYSSCLGRFSTFLLRQCVISPMGFPMASQSHKQQAARHWSNQIRLKGFQIRLNGFHLRWWPPLLRPPFERFANKCSYTLGEHFDAILDLPAPI